MPFDLPPTGPEESLSSRATERHQLTFERHREIAENKKAPGDDPGASGFPADEKLFFLGGLLGGRANRRGALAGPAVDAFLVVVDGEGDGEGFFRELVSDARERDLAA